MKRQEVLRGFASIVASVGLAVCAPHAVADVLPGDSEVYVPEPESPPPPPPPPSAEVPSSGKGPHEFTWAFRGAAWISTVGGTIDPVKASETDLDDFEPGASFDAHLRLRKHDLRMVYRYYNNDGGAKGTVGGVPLKANANFEVNTLGLDYEYSFWTIEENGFRLGPGVGVGLIFPDIKVTEVRTGLKGKFDDFIPAPTVRLQGEVPIWKDFLFHSSAGAFYLPPVGNKNLEGFLFEMRGLVFYRPLSHLGFYTGLEWLHVDAQNDKSLNLDLDIWGPVVGVELRF